MEYFANKEIPTKQALLHGLNFHEYPTCGEFFKKKQSASEVQNDNSVIVSDSSQSKPNTEQGSTSNGTLSVSYFGNGAQPSLKMQLLQLITTIESQQGYKKQATLKSKYFLKKGRNNKVAKYRFQ